VRASLEWDDGAWREIQDALRRLAEDAQREWTQACGAEAEAIMADAKELTPVDTGNLRASGHVRPPVLDGGQVTVTMGFGGAAAPYALYVHEDLRTFHNVGQAKYLEQPFNAHARVFVDRLLDRMRAALSRLGR
jgi:hypothetical protein